MQKDVGPSVAHVAVSREYAIASWLMSTVGVTVQSLLVPPDASFEAKIPEPPMPMHNGFDEVAVHVSSVIPDDVLAFGEAPYG
jgi:hypothetical protein